MGLPGLRVGAGRWPYVSCHPDAWQRPWAGVVLARDDPLAWTDTIAFSGRPTRKQVRDHLMDLERRARGLDDIPVLWDFADVRSVRWESATRLVSVAEDVMRWETARAKARADEERTGRLRDGTHGVELKQQEAMSVGEA